MTAPTEEQPATAAAGWIEDEDTFAARLQAVRRRMGWGNVSEAARACGLPAENWRLWEQGRFPSRLTTVAMVIAGKTGADYLWLVHGKSRGAVGQTGVTLREPTFPRIDPLAARPITHKDRRRRSTDRVTAVRYYPAASTSTAARVTVPLVARA